MKKISAVFVLFVLGFATVSFAGDGKCVLVATFLSNSNVAMANYVAGTSPAVNPEALKQVTFGRTHRIRSVETASQCSALLDDESSLQEIAGEKIFDFDDCESLKLVWLEYQGWRTGWKVQDSWNIDLED